MIAGWWLAIAGLPVHTSPLPSAPEHPAAVAVASRQVPLRLPCYRLACSDAEWTPVASYQRIWSPRAPGVRARTVAPAVVKLPNRRLAPLNSPYAPRDRIRSGGNHVKWDTTYGLEAIRSPDTLLQVEFGTGLRIEPYTDYGTAVPGLVARGGFSLQQRFGNRALWNQRVLFETGRENTYVRQSVGLDLRLADDWMLHSSLEMWHDTAANGGEGRTEKTGSLRLRYAF